MNAVTIDEITKKLKVAPSSILEKIWGYANALLENKEVAFKLSEKQKAHLLKQNQVSIEECKDAEEIYFQLKKKYEL